MATAGLSFANPMLGKMNVGEEPNPYVPFNPMSDIGAGGLGPSTADVATMGAALAPQSQFTLPAMQQPPSIAFSPSSKKLFVNGITFDADDAAQALQSENYLRGPGTGLPQGGDWVPLDEGAYSQYLNAIRNPSLSRLASKNFGRGVDTLQMLAGRGLQLAGAEELGGRIVEQQIGSPTVRGDLEKTAPYERMFTDIDSGSGAVDWLVANFAQQGPNLIESVLTAGLGFLAGSAAGGPLAGAGGALAGLMGKESFKQSVIATLKKKAAGETLEKGEEKLLREAAGIAGAVTTSYAQNLSTGAADIYGEMREQGVGVDDMGARLKALAGSVPYALLETLSEYIAAVAVMRGGTRGALPSATSTTRAVPGGTQTITSAPTAMGRAGEYLKRGAVGFGIGGTAEGTTELGQEALVMGFSGQDLNSPEATKRFINSFTAGFGIGGPIGAALNLRSNKPENLLKPGGTAEQKPGTAEQTRGPLAPGEQGQLFPVSEDPAAIGPPALEGAPSDRNAQIMQERQGLLEQRRGLIQFIENARQELSNAGNDPTRSSMLQRNLDQATTALAQIDQQLGAEQFSGLPGAALPDALAQRQQRGLFDQPPPPLAPPSPQMSLFRGQMPLTRVQPVAPPTLANYPAALNSVQASDPRQGALQFTAPAPSPVNPVMVQALAAAQRRQAFAEAEAQRAAQRQAEMNRLANVAAAQRQLDFAAQQQPQQLPSLPMRRTGPTAPQQLPLFTRRELPRPSRAESLRRGAPLPPIGELAPTPLTAAQRRAQLSLFTKEGEPTVAGLKGAAIKSKVAPAPKKPAATKTAGARGLKKNARVAEVNIKEEPKRAVQKPSAAPVSLRQGTATGKGVRSEDKAGDQAAAKGEALKRAETEKRRDATVKKAETIQAGRQWSQYADPDTQPKWSELTDEQKEKWRKVVIDDSRPSIAVTKEIAPPKKTEGVQETPAEKWDAERLPGDVAYVDLPQSAKDAWDTSGLTGAEQASILQQLADDVLPMTVAERFNYNVAQADEAVRAGDFDKLEGALADPGGVLETAFFTPRGPNTNERIAEAQTFVESLMQDFPAAQEVVADAFVMLASGQRLEAYAKGGADKGNATAWYTLAKNTTGMLQRLAKVDVVFVGLPQAEAKALLDNGFIGLNNLPDTLAKEFSKATPEQKAGSTPKRSPAVRLAEKINDLNKSTVANRGAEARARAIEKLAELWAKVKDANLNTTEADALVGAPLGKFFTKDGQPITNIISGRLRVATKKLTKDEIAAIERINREEARLAEQQRKEGEVSLLDDFDGDVDSGRYSTADGTPIRKPMSVGQAKIAVSRFLSRLFAKPRVFVYRNQADLKASNPDLYRRAAAARTQGDFDTASAAGYSFGDGNVIIFTDRIKTNDHLNFVLAHETLGHFGLRSMMPAKQFNALMESIYDQSQAVRDGADAAMQTRGSSKAEAVEEYLADFAAELDVSLVARIFNAIKNMLNKLGVKFADDAARYWVNQARRYVRNGDTTGFFTAREVAARINALEGGLDPDGTGRFANSGTLRADNMLFEFTADTYSGMPDSLADASKRIRDKVGDTFDSVEKFKSKFFSLLNFRARENAGFAELDRILRSGRGFAMSMKIAANEKMAVVLNRAVASAVAGWKNIGGITDAQINQLNSMLYSAQRFAVAKLKPSDLGKTPLFSVAADGTVTPNTTELDRIFALGTLTFEQARDGYSYKVTYLDGGKEVTKTVAVPGIADLDEKGPVWQGYLRTRETLRDVEMQLLRARYASYTQDRDLAFREIGDATLAKKLTAADQKFLEKMYRKYRDLWTANTLTDAEGNPAYNPDSLKKANEFIVALNKTITLGADRDYAALREFFGDAADDTITTLDDFKTRFVLSEENKYLIQNRLKDIIVAEISNTDADAYTKTTLASGYTPVLREGEFQVRVMATDRAGKVVRLKQAYKEQLVYSQTATNSEARNLAKEINGMFGDKIYEVEAYNPDTRKYELMEVRLNAVSESAITQLAAPPDLNLSEFTRGLRQFSITLDPRKLEEVIRSLTTQNSSARNRLLRAFTPGASPDAIKALTKHIESRASVAAKILMRPKISELTNLNLSTTQKLWSGDEAKLNALRSNYERVLADPNSTDDERVSAKMEYGLYNFQYQKANRADGTDRGNMYYNEAASTLAFLDNNRDVNESDFGAGEVASNVRAYTSMLQLGASIATGALNYIGAITNGIPFLATYNDKTAFGGGFGLGRSLAEFQRALSQVGLIRSLGERGLNAAEFYDGVVKSPALQKKYGLTEAEARFMAREIRDGTMIPALSNALLASARGRVTLGAGQKAIDGWMWTFNVTEQASRRALGLAAYRMQYSRSRSAGMTEADADASAREFAVNTLNFTVGDYSVMNRPPVWRSGIQSFLYMYKVFPTTSIQMLSRLPLEGKIYMLGALWILGGVAAMPFAEDIEDLLDTIAQALGLKMGSVRVELAKAIDAIAPGASPYLIRGFANAYFPGNIADRVSLSDFIPGTGILLAGADVGRELTEVAGPAASMLTGVASFVPRLAQAALTERVTLVDAMRESPVTMLRAAGDSLAYGQAGAVLDKRGYVVSPDVNAATIMTRMAGFYPASAAQQYQIIRASKRITDYQRETTAGFRAAWIKAKISGDEDQARAIVDAVSDWNEGTKGTALEIRKFLPNSQKALREARRPAQERLLRAAPKAARDDLEALADLLGYNDD